MKLLVVLFALIAAAFAAPQFFGSPYGGYGGGFGHPGFGGGFSGSNAHASAGSSSFGGGFPGGFSGSNAFANAGSSSFGFGR